MSAKRVLLTTIVGLVLGGVEWLIAPSGTTTQMPIAAALTMILGRGTLGFAIGISAWKLGWWLHGLLVGLIFSLPPAFGAMWLAGQWTTNFITVLIAGVVIGVLIELLTSVVFKARAWQPAAVQP